MAGRLSPGMAELKRLYDEASTDERRRVLRMLAYVKGIWFCQPVDVPTVNVWYDILWDIDWEDGVAAARDYSASDLFGPDQPPTPQQLRNLALVKRRQRQERLRQQLKRLEAPGREVGLTPEEREAGLKVLREAIKKAGK